MKTISKRRRAAAAAILLLAAPLLIGARGYQTHPYPAVLLASDDQPGREIDAEAGAVITRSVAMQAPTARLGAPIRLDIASRDQSLEAGAELRFVGVAGDAAERLPDAPEAFCAVPRVGAGAAARVVLDTAAFGLLRGLNRSAPLSTHCFVDADGDDRFETVFLSGARRDADIVPRSIDPLPATITRHQPIEGVSEGRIVYAGPTGRRARRIAFRFETASPAGEAVEQEVRSVIDVDDLPKTIRIQGAEIEVLSFDAASGRARMRLVRPMEAGGYGFTPPPQTIYIPIYIPR
jgi:hypothetical protein